MKPKTFVLRLILAITLPGGVNLAGQQVTDPNSPETLQDYLRVAFLNNAELKASFEQWKAALQKAAQAKGLDDPTFTYSYYIEHVETRVGPQRHKFGIMQVFPWFGKIEARTDAAAAQAKAARQRYEAAKLKLFWQVKEGFYEYLYLASAIEIAKQNLELLKHFGIRRLSPLITDQPSSKCSYFFFDAFHVCVIAIIIDALLVFRKGDTHGRAQLIKHFRLPFQACGQVVESLVFYSLFECPVDLKKRLIIFD